jgi:hypothetical protein
MKYIKWSKNKPNRSEKMNILFPRPSKYTKIGIFGTQKRHLATLVPDT